MKKQRLGLRRLYQQLDKILLLFFMIFMVMEVVWVPFNSFAADLLLSQTGQLYLSYSNALAVFTSNPLVTVGLVGLFVANLFIAYLQMGTIFMGIHQLLKSENPSMRHFIKRTFQQSWNLVKHFHISKALFILLYAGLLFPIMRKALNLRYFNKFVLPEFIETWLLNKPLFAALLLSLSLLGLYLAVRLVYALPELLFEGKTVREAVKSSWKQSQGRFWRTGRSLFWLLIKVGLFFTFWSFVVIVLQVLADQLPETWSFGAALVNFALIKVIYYLTIIYFMVHFVTLVTERDLPDFDSRIKTHGGVRFAILGASSLVFLGQGYLILTLPAQNLPLVISHRGVSEANGVQNTIESLETTSKLKPDLVEMDVQETKDGQFVMMHDSNLKDLAGVDAKPQELTLEELTNLTVKENGQEAKIPSFDAYLKRADELGVKLLIEIKTSKLDSPDMMERFLKAYGPTIIAKGHQMHSLDYQVVESVRKYSSKIPVYFILPYNSIFPQTAATGYTMEFTTLDDDFMVKLWLNDKKAYAWTINDESSLQKTLNLGVDGIITDDLQLVQAEVASLNSDRNYAEILSDQLWHYANVFE